METSKTYVFNPEGSGNNGGMMSLIAPLLQQRGVDPNVLLAMKGNNGFGNGDGSWFIWLLFILCFCGWGGNGFGFGGRGNGAGLANEINNDYGRSLLMDAIGGNRNALSNLATQLNCTEGQIQQAISALTSQVQNVGNQVGMSGMQTINALQQGNMQIASQLADCCCKVNNNITAMDGNVKLAMCQQTGTLNNAINNVADFDSICMNMTQAFQSLVSVAAKAETVDALLSIKEQLDSMMNQLDSEIDSYDASVDSDKDAAITDSVAAKAEDVDTDFDITADSALTQVRNNVAKLNIIVKAVATGKANIKTHGKEQLLKFITDCYEGFEQILAFVSVVESEGRYTFPSQVTEYIKSRQSILTTCYDNVAISE